MSFVRFSSVISLLMIHRPTLHRRSASSFSTARKPVPPRSTLSVSQRRPSPSSALPRSCATRRSTISRTWIRSLMTAVFSSSWPRTARASPPTSTLRLRAACSESQTYSTRIGVSETPAGHCGAQNSGFESYGYCFEIECNCEKKWAAVTPVGPGTQARPDVAAGWKCGKRGWLGTPPPPVAVLTSRLKVPPLNS